MHPHSSSMTCYGNSQHEFASEIISPARQTCRPGYIFYFDYFMTPIFTVIFTYLLLLPLTFQCCHVYSWHYLTVKWDSEKPEHVAAITLTLSPCCWMNGKHKFTFSLHFSKFHLNANFVMSNEQQNLPFIIGDLDPIKYTILLADPTYHPK